MLNIMYMYLYVTLQILFVNTIEKERFTIVFEVSGDKCRER